MTTSSSRWLSPSITHMWRGNNVLVSKVGVQVILDDMFMTDMSQFMAEHCGPTYCSGILADQLIVIHIV